MDAVSEAVATEFEFPVCVVLKCSYSLIPHSQRNTCKPHPSRWLCLTGRSEDNGVAEYSTVYSGCLSSFSSPCGWWGWRAAVSFYEPHALEKMSSNLLSKTLMRSTHGRARSGGVGRGGHQCTGGVGSVRDGWRRKKQCFSHPCPAVTSNALEKSSKRMPPSTFLWKTV